MLELRRDPTPTCPLCREALDPSSPSVACPGCSTRYHRSCYGELGGCATLGCSGAAARAGQRPAPAAPEVPTERALGRRARGPSTQPVRPSRGGLLVVLLGAGFLALCAWFFAFAAATKLSQPSAFPGFFPRSDAEDLRAIVAFTGVMAAFATLVALLFAVALARGDEEAPEAAPAPGDNPTDPDVAPSVPVPPSALLAGKTSTSFTYVPPAQAGTCALGCGGATTALLLAGLASWAWWPLPTWTYVVGAAGGLVGALQTGWAVRAWLAARLLTARFTRFPVRPIRPGQTVTAECELHGHATTRIHRVTAVLACVEQWKTSSENARGHTTTTTHQRIVHRQRLRLDGLTLRQGERRRYPLRFELPADAPSSRPGHHPICWIVGLVVDVPNWPDYELARELEVSAAG